MEKRKLKKKKKTTLAPTVQKHNQAGKRTLTQKWIFYVNGFSKIISHKGGLKPSTITHSVGPALKKGDEKTHMQRYLVCSASIVKTTT